MFKVAECITFVASENEDPLTEGIRALSLNGDDERAAAFIENLSDSVSTETTQSLQEVLDAPDPGSTGAAAERMSSDGAMQSLGTKYSDGQLSGDVNWELYADVAYGYCTSISNCTAIGRTNFNFWQELFYYSTDGVSLAGSVYTYQGSAVSFQESKCTTYYEISPFDQPLHDWANCNLGSYPGTVKQINFANFQQGSAVGTQYHLEWRVAFKVQGDPVGAQFSRLWNSYSYRIYASPLHARYQS